MRFCIKREQRTNTCTCTLLVAAAKTTYHAMNVYAVYTVIVVFFFVFFVLSFIPGGQRRFSVVRRSGPRRREPCCHRPWELCWGLSCGARGWPRWEQAYDRREQRGYRYVYHVYIYVKYCPCACAPARLR